MEDAENALEARVAELLAHLDSAPVVRAALPFTVSYLVERLREASTAALRRP